MEQSILALVGGQILVGMVGDHLLSEPNSGRNIYTFDTIDKARQATEGRDPVLFFEAVEWEELAINDEFRSMLGCDSILYVKSSPHRYHMKDATVKYDPRHDRGYYWREIS